MEYKKYDFSIFNKSNYYDIIIEIKIVISLLLYNFWH